MFLTPAQEILREEIREFAEKNLRGGLMRHTRGPEFPAAAYRALGDAGYLGMMIPKEYGGLGLGVTEYCILLEELARVDHNVPWAIDNSFAVASVISLMGSHEVKQKFLPRITSSELIPSFALTDLAGGSNLKAMSTFAVRDEAQGIYRVNGKKTHLHGVQHSNVWLIFARTEDGSDALLVENPNGVSELREYQPFGFRCLPCHEVEFADTKVPVSQLLGERGKGVFYALSKALNYTRIGNASIVIGIAKAAMDVALSFAMGRTVANGVITDQQAIKHMLADLITELDAAELLRWKAAWMHDTGQSPVREASEAKLFATEHCGEICGKLLRLFGAYGTYEEFPLADYFASCKVLELGSGASEIHRNNISRVLLKEFGARFESGELAEWATTDHHSHILEINRSTKESVA